MKKIIITTFAFCLANLLLVKNVFAQITPAPLGNLEGLGTIGEVIRKLSPSNVTPASNLLTRVLSIIIGLITIVAGLWFMIQILLAGFNWISSSGDKNKVQEAQHKITNSIIGLTIVVAAYALTNLFGKILGIDILDLGGAITSLGIK